MKTLAPLLASFSLVVAAVPAQGPKRFALPSPPFDYFAAPPRDASAIPARNDTLPVEVANARAALGRVLFYDVELSHGRTRACGSCHRQEHAFADDRARSRGVHGPTARNTMTLQNLAQRNGGFFWDDRAPTLAQAVLQPVGNHTEMGMTMPALVDRLAAMPDYAPLFVAAFGDDRVTEARIGWGLAQFVGALVSNRSRYDTGLAMAGGKVDDEFANFTAAENRGKALFVGTGNRARSCAECHMGRDFGPCGHTWWPRPVSLQGDGCRNNGLDMGTQGDDPGLGGITGEAADRGNFRPPSLRNIAVTAPYMHDGRFATLDDVLRFYANGVRTPPNLDTMFTTNGRISGWGGGAAPLAGTSATTMSPLTNHGFGFNDAQRRDLIAFLNTLTDQCFLRDPRFADPFAQP